MKAEEFHELVRQSFTPANASLVLKAHDYAVERLGSDLQEHIEILDLLLHQHADHITITAAILTPLRRCGAIKARDLERIFGTEVADLVSKAYSEEILRTDTETHRREDLQTLLESFSDDIRALVLRINLRCADLQRRAVQGNGESSDMARETLELYVPLADRMGMGILRSRLEDSSFHILEPDIYAKLAQELEPIRAEDEQCLKILQGGIKYLFERSGIKGEVQGRTKGVYSLYRKLSRLGDPLESIMDKIGVRVIVPSVKDCYTALGLLHTHFRPIPNTFDDYIKSPKSNGYQSLHTCVYPVPDISHKPVEIQIRTQAMHREAEFGIAAHWQYKSAEESHLDNNRQLQWLQKLLSHHEESTSHAEFIEHLRRQVAEECSEGSNKVRS